jgi:hypothetical protein
MALSKQEREHKMNKLDILEAMAEAEAAVKEAGLWRLGPDGMERVEEKVVHEVPQRTSGPRAFRLTGKPRKGSKQWRKEHGGIV